MPSEIDNQDYYFAQAHRRASEEYIAASQHGQTREEALTHCDKADSAGRQAFVLAGNALQRLSEISFLQANYGLRVLIELNYESVVTRQSTENVDTSPDMLSELGVHKHD